MHEDRGRQPSLDVGAGARILLISASMGAGHDGAARALATQLRADGHEAEVKDFLLSGPLRIGTALRRGYEFELKHVPSAYDATYRLWYRAPWLCPIVAWLVTALTRRRVLRWVRDTEADAVVSTYPLATLCLGRLRAKGRLRIPAINFITDFGVHPLWVHPGMDLNLAVHDGPAQMAAARTGKPSIACGPVVSPSFDRDRLPERAAARQAIGLRAGQRAVLVVAGSWGVGDVDATWAAIAGDGRFTPVVVCGRDHGLETEVTALAQAGDIEAVVLGWTSEMPALMAACDALVENAGGLTSLEAMRAGLPVVSFHPIAGHGKENTARMAAAGVSRLARDATSLAECLAALTAPGPERDAQVARGRAMFRAEAADLVIDRARQAGTVGAGTVGADTVAAGSALAGSDRRRGRRRVTLVAVRAAVALVVVTTLGWVGLTRGVAVATEAGAGVAHPAPGSGAVVYVGVRLNEAEVASPAIVSALRAMGLTAVIDDATAMANPAAVRSLAAAGVNVENGGHGDRSGHQPRDNDPLPWSRARSDARAGQQIGQIIDEPVTVTVPGRRLNVWDLVECGDVHSSLVVPNHILDAGATGAALVIHLSARHIYMVNGLTATPKQLLAYLSELDTSIETAHLSAVPFAALA